MSTATAQEVYIVAAPGEEPHAETLAGPLREAGYDVTHNGTVLVGDSIVGEATRALGRGAPVVLCATYRAVGSEWTHKIVNAAHTGPPRVFVVQMDEGVHIAPLAVNTVVARYDQDPGHAVAQLLTALRSRFPPLPPPAPAPPPTGAGAASEESPLQFMDRPSGVTVHDHEALQAFRADLREEVLARYPAGLTGSEFLSRAAVSVDGVLTRTGALLFARHPGPESVRSMVKCVRYFGTDRSAARDSLTLEGPVAEVIVAARAFVADRVRVAERPSADLARAEPLYAYPMIAVREIIANAVVHRDYARDDACVHVRLFEDRLEISSPGGWYGRAVGVRPLDLGALEGQSAKRNFQLARLLAWTRLVEGEGSGIPTALADCAEAGTTRPSVVEADGFVTVTIRPLEGSLVPPGPAAVALPLQIGVMPRRADSYQVRAVEEEVRTALADGLDVVLTGLGGIGKTQLAANAARELAARRRPDLLLWVAAGSREAIVRSYAQAAVALLPHAPAGDPEAAAALLLAHLASERLNWLVVLDDVVNPADLRELWPPYTPCGNVLVTTRRRDSALGGELRRLISPGPFTPEESRAYLTGKLAAAGRLPEPASLDELAAQLDHIPLALAQATAYMIDADLDVGTYLALLADYRLVDVLPDDSALPDGQLATVSTTVVLSIEQADRMRPAGLARPLLELGSVLAAGGTPVAVLLGDSARRYLSARSGQQVDRLSAQLALRSLDRLGLVTLTAESVEVHGIVQRVTAEGLSEEVFQQTAVAAGDALVEIWPEIENDTDLAQALRANAHALVAQALAVLCREEAHPVLLRLARSIGEAMPASAAAYLRPVCVYAAVQLGADHPLTLALRGWEALYRLVGGDVAAAADTLARLVADETRVLGPTHPATLTAAHNLAWATGQSGDAAGAVGILVAMLPDTERALGPDHPETLSVRHSLAYWRSEAGDTARAAREYEEVLSARRAVLGNDHPQTFATRGNLAMVLVQRGDTARAVAQLKALLADEIRVLGPEHPSTLLTRGNLANALGGQGDFPAAVRLQRQLVAEQTRVLGPEHPNTLTSRNNLATWLGAAGDGVEAARTLIPLAADQIRVLGADHPEAVGTRRNLARWLGAALEEHGAAPVAAAGIVTALDPVLARRVRKRLAGRSSGELPWEDVVERAFANGATDLLEELMLLPGDPAPSVRIVGGTGNTGILITGAHGSAITGVVNTGVVLGGD
ncbi:tetratricopeptide repeat protein [Streptomyces sp. NPDC090022]|uniref:tetratricopeptide repeat protein n=1 Tax=Streptomyces sp. NPDC090022 TaxID=3365920 RepID=UPI0037FF93B8